MSQAILCLAANPSRSSRLALDQECAAIERELRMTSHRDAFDFRSKWAVTFDEMLHHLYKLQPAIIHFSGHGAAHASDGIYLKGLEGDRGGSQLVTARALTAMIRSAASPRLVVLDACYSAPQAEALRDVADCVVGTSSAIGDAAARSFAASFYRALGHQCSVGSAVDQAVATLAAKGMPDEALPRCLTRHDIDKYQIFLDLTDHGTIRWMSDASRPTAPAGRAAERRANQRLPASDLGTERYGEGVGGLGADEILAMFRSSPGGDPPTSVEDLRSTEALAPYLAGSELSADAYKEWLTRVCEQPDDD
jgi:CHAT domain-containing protein